MFEAIQFSGFFFMLGFRALFNKAGHGLVIGGNGRGSGSVGPGLSSMWFSSSSSSNGDEKSSSEESGEEKSGYNAPQSREEDVLRSAIESLGFGVVSSAKSSTADAGDGEVRPALDQEPVNSPLRRVGGGTSQLIRTEATGGVSGVGLDKFLRKRKAGVVRAEDLKTAATEWEMDVEQVASVAKWTSPWVVEEREIRGETVGFGVWVRGQGQGR